MPTCTTYNTLTGVPCNNYFYTFTVHIHLYGCITNHTCYPTFTFYVIWPVSHANGGALTYPLLLPLRALWGIVARLRGCAFLQKYLNYPVQNIANLPLPVSTCLLRVYLFTHLLPQSVPTCPRLPAVTLRHKVCQGRSRSFALAGRSDLVTIL